LPYPDHLISSNRIGQCQLLHSASIGQQERFPEDKEDNGPAARVGAIANNVAKLEKPTIKAT
jgi:hypothetical protein